MPTVRAMVFQGWNRAHPNGRAPSTSIQNGHSRPLSPACYPHLTCRGRQWWARWDAMWVGRLNGLTRFARDVPPIGDLNKRSAGVQTTSAFNRRLFRYLVATSYGRPHWHKRSVYGGYADLSRGPPVVRVAGGGTTINEIVVVLVGRCGTMT